MLSKVLRIPKTVIDRFFKIKTGTEQKQFKEPKTEKNPKPEFFWKAK